MSLFEPFDIHNEALEAAVKPRDWKNPVPDGRYNLVVIGAGTAGLVTAAGAAGLGAKVALIERSAMGGDCLNFGCVPSKALLSAARYAAAVQNAGDFGVQVTDRPNIDFAGVMERVRRLRARISPNDSAERFRKLGVDVFFGDGRFVNSQTIDVAGTRLSFKRAVIATGARAAIPSIPGLESIRYLTNESLFSLTRQPRSMAIIGAGPIGCEMAQAFARLGTNVLLFESDAGLLTRDDREAASVVRASLEHDRVRFVQAGNSLRITPDSTSSGAAVLNFQTPAGLVSERVDCILISAGRTPNVESLNLDAVGVQSHEKGIVVNDFLQTTNQHIYAAGDVCSSFQFTHAADFMARAVIQNTLFFGRARMSRLVIPWCTYTSPELAQVGLTETHAAEQGIAFDVWRQSLHDLDRAILDGSDHGFVKMLTTRGTDRIIGATIVGPHAGDLISEVTLAINQRVGLRKLALTIHPYPTLADAIRKLGDQYNRTRLTPLVKRLFNTWLSWTR